MEDSKKRVRDDSAESESLSVDSPESKIPRVDSSDLGINPFGSQHDSVFESEEQQQDDILNILYYTDNVGERDWVQGLDSVIKSFEDEINAPSSDLGDPAQIPDPGDLQSSLGYLLEASDDELGLPPTEAAGKEPGRINPEMMEIGSLTGFEDYTPSYDAFGFGSGFGADIDGGGGAYVTVDGLFDYVEPATDVLWRSESLKAI